MFLREATLQFAEKNFSEEKMRVSLFNWYVVVSFRLQPLFLISFSGKIDQERCEGHKKYIVGQGYFILRNNAKLGEVRE